ncbi:MAG: FAD-dependent oxidoreductase, partial [Planktotalea sp.]
MQTLRNTSQGSSSALVIGGGIVGLATAYALCQQGIRVTVLDDAAVDHRASSATAGIIGGSSVIPWANSKLWPRLPLHFLDQ